MKLVHDAICAGIFNDMGSGSNVDLAVIKANDNVSYHRGYADKINKKGERNSATLTSPAPRPSSARS